jgi:hypothetical protein
LTVKEFAEWQGKQGVNERVASSAFPIGPSPQPCVDLAKFGLGFLTSGVGTKGLRRWVSTAKTGACSGPH